MNLFKKTVLLSCALLLSGGMAIAQEFRYEPSAPLTVDPAVKVGKLKNGFTY